MLPTLIDFGPIKIATLPIFLVVAFFLGLFVVWKRGRELHYDEKDLFDSVFGILLWTFVGARLGYVIIHIIQVGIEHTNWWWLVSNSGWYFPIGFVFAWWGIQRAARRYRWDAYQLMDTMVTGLTLVLAIIALGSFVAGVGYGVATESLVGIRFAGLYDKRYPIQLWEMLGFGVCFGYLWWVEGVYRTFPWYRGKKSQAATGFVTSMFLLWWGFITFVALLFKSPMFTVAGYRIDYAVPVIGGIIGGGILLMYRASGSWQGLYTQVLDYFGLSKKTA